MRSIKEMKYSYIFAMKRVLLHQCPTMKHSFTLVDIL